MMVGDDLRLSQVHALLEREGVAGARVSVAGHGCDIAVIEAATTPARLLPLVAEIRSLGFRYVTLELPGETHG
jgi:hypothetical protein